MRRSVLPVVLAFAVVFFLGLTAAQAPKAGDAALGTRKYADYQTPQFCGTSCHTDIYQQWQQAMMSQAYTHHWDEIEYFKLAVPHAEKDSVVAGVKAGCNGCHAPIAFLAGDVPPPLPVQEQPGQRIGLLRGLPHRHRLRRRHAPQLQLGLGAGQDQVRPARGQELAGAQPGQVRVPRHGRVLRHLPQRDEPLRRLGQIDPPRVEGRSVRQAGRQVPRLPHDLRPGQVRGHGQRPIPTSASTSSTAPTTPARSGARSSSASTPTSARPCPATRSSSRSPSSTRRPATSSPPARSRTASSGCTSRPSTPRARSIICPSTRRASPARSTRSAPTRWPTRTWASPSTIRTSRASSGTASPSATASSAWPTSIPRAA